VAGADPLSDPACSLGQITRLVLNAWFKPGVDQHAEQTNISISPTFDTIEFGTPLAGPGSQSEKRLIRRRRRVMKNWIRSFGPAAALAVALLSWTWAAGLSAAPVSEHFRAARGQDSERPRGQDTERPRGQDSERPRGQDAERPRGEDGQRPRGDDSERPRGR
jgi:hypothetical protein